MLVFRGLPGTPDPYVKINVFDFRTHDLLEELSNWSQLTGTSVNINAIDNGTHGDGGTKFTFHGKSLAWDVSPTTTYGQEYASLAKHLQMRLPPPYQVVIEKDHIHIEWDTVLGR